MWILIFLGILCSVFTGNCRPNGAPNKSCFYMTPRHIHPHTMRKVFPTSANGLYNITTSSDIFRPDKPIRGMHSSFSPFLFFFPLLLFLLLLLLLSVFVLITYDFILFTANAPDVCLKRHYMYMLPIHSYRNSKLSCNLLKYIYYLHLPMQ